MNVNLKPGQEKKQFLESKELKPFIDKLKTILKNHPEFTMQYENEDKAFDVLILYSLSHISRYLSLIIGAIPSVNGVKLQTPQSEGENRINAEKSLTNFIKLQEDSSRILFERDTADTDKRQNEYYKYLFNPEEVKADINGSNFLIEEYSKKILDDTLSEEDIDFFSSKIEEEKKNIEFRIKGLEYLQKCDELKKKPNDTELKEKTEQ